MTDPTPQKPSIPSQAYEANYYKTACDGYKEFAESHGRSLPLRLQLPLALAGIMPGMRIADIGCGRGEIVFHAVKSGAKVWGLDYSRDAVEIARATLKDNLTPELFQNCVIQQSDATRLPFEDSELDRVFMLDVVEHLTPQELSTTLQEIHRVLQPGGYLIIHTMPSLWYYRYGYPLFRFIQSLRGIRLPRNPRERYSYSQFHINEQTLFSLRRVVTKNGFKAHVWLQTTQEYENEENRSMRALMSFLVRVYPFRWIFCDDIFAIGKKNI